MRKKQKPSKKTKKINFMEYSLHFAQTKKQCKFLM